MQYRYGWILVWTFGLVALALMFTVSASAAESALPRDGATVRITGDTGGSGIRLAMIDGISRTGDPDAKDFGERCSLSSPMHATVLGTFDHIIVVRYTVSMKPDREYGYSASGRIEPGGCRNHGVVLLDLPAWKALKGLEARQARARDAKARRRAKVRAIVRAASHRR